MEVTKNKEQEGQGQDGQKPDINPAIIEELMKGYQRPEDLTGPGEIMEQLTKRLYERVLGAEMTHYFGYEKGQAPDRKVTFDGPCPFCGEMITHTDIDRVARSSPPSAKNRRPNSMSVANRRALLFAFILHPSSHGRAFS
jgi:hypothetical protein